MRDVCINSMVYSVYIICTYCSVLTEVVRGVAFVFAACAVVGRVVESIHM